MQENSNNGGIVVSKKKWIWLGLLVALVNPIFSGLILGAVYLSEPELRGAGRAIAAISIIWGAFLYYFVQKNLAVNLFGF